MKTQKRALCLLLCLLFVLGAAACGEKQASEVVSVTEAPQETLPLTTAAALEPQIQQVVVGTSAPTAVPTPTPTPTAEPTPSPAPTASPTSGPQATREPIPGDVTTNFPNYDTGVDADYSYQSDELRIAIKKVMDPVDDDVYQVYYVADIWIRNINASRTGFGHGEYGQRGAIAEDAESFAQREHAVLAVNGSANNGVLFHNGELVKDKVDRKYEAMVMYNDGTMKTFDVLRSGFNLRAEMKKGIRHIWQFGPILVQDGKDMQKGKSSTRHPRIMLGYYEPGHYVIVAVDGRTSTAIGMTNGEMSELMVSLGCQEAINLDGGTSAVMTFMGQIISSPSKMGTNKAEGGRNLLDMVLFAEYDAEGNAPALTDIPAEKYSIMEESAAN